MTTGDDKVMTDCPKGDDKSADLRLACIVNKAGLNATSPQF